MSISGALQVDQLLSTAADMTLSLMAGDPAQFKAGYTQENAVRATIEWFQLRGITIDRDVLTKAVGDAHVNWLLS